jgi:threonine dehydratase
MTKHAVDSNDVLQAAETIRSDVVHTPTRWSRTLSDITGAHVQIKFENQQFTASFKDRGAASKLRSLTPQQRERGVVAMSAGNHAQGVAYHAGRLGIPATIVMPESAPFSKVSHTASHGADVRQVGATLSQASDAAEAIVEDTGACWVHPYNDALVIAGQGTVAVELMADAEDLDAIVVPTGGGGLLAGIAAYVKANHPKVKLYGVQSEVYPGMIAALDGRTLEPGAHNTLADGIAVKQPGTLTVPIIDHLVDDVFTVSEPGIEAAVALFLEVEKTVAEGAAAAALAALVERPDLFRDTRVGVILSGGNIDTRVLASVLMRQLVDSGRIHQLRIALPDLPGQLAPVIETIAAAGANVIEVNHRRLFDPLSARATTVELVIETRDQRHAAAVVAELGQRGYPTQEEPC